MRYVLSWPVVGGDRVLAGMSSPSSDLVITSRFVLRKMCNNQLGFVFNEVSNAKHTTKKNNNKRDMGINARFREGNRWRTARSHVSTDK